MAFSKKVQQTSVGTGGSTISSEEWDEWNKLTQWDILDVEPQKLPNGKEVKEMQVIGVLNYIQELGSQVQDDASMVSKLKVPEEGEENSQEEIEEMTKYPMNYFKWVDDYDNGKKVRVRKKFWPKQPEEELVFAVDFPELKVDYSQHPASTAEKEDIRPLRIDYNGKDFKDKSKLGRHITNEVNYKTGKFSPTDIKYKIASACGFLDEYQEDDHDLAHLVQATCYWTIKMTKAEKDGNTYYNTKILEPAMIQDIKARGKVVATVEEQMEDAKCDVPFCGILMDGGDYPDENLKQIRKMWRDLAKSAVTFDRNEGTSRDGEWICGLGYEGSDFQKALEAYEAKMEETSPTEKKPVTKPKREVPKNDPEPVGYNEPPMDFDDDIPF